MRGLSLVPLKASSKRNRCRFLGDRLISSASFSYSASISGVSSTGVNRSSTNLAAEPCTPLACDAAKPHRMGEENRVSLARCADAASATAAAGVDALGTHARVHADVDARAHVLRRTTAPALSDRSMGPARRVL